MAYLKKNERYNAILETAMKIITQEGIAAITARRIANEANIAVGQIHHHFKSVGQLKAEALAKVTEELITKAQHSYQNESIVNQIINIISPIEGEIGSVMRKLWNEAVFLAERDPDIKLAYKQSIEEWHSATTKLIEEGKQKQLITTQNSSGLAWQLIALSCGFDSLAVIEEFRFDIDTIKNHIIKILCQKE